MRCFLAAVSFVALIDGAVCLRSRNNRSRAKDNALSELPFAGEATVDVESSSAKPLSGKKFNSEYRRHLAALNKLKALPYKADDIIKMARKRLNDEVRPWANTITDPEQKKKIKNVQFDFGFSFCLEYYI
jgi:hypothetical protein